MPEALAAAPHYSLVSVSLDAAPESLAAEWKVFQAGYSCASPVHDLEWLRGFLDGQTKDLLLYSLYESDRLCGIAAFLHKDWPLRWCLGEFTIASLPLTRLRLLGGTLAIPPEQAAHDLLFRDLAQRRAGVDAVFLEEVPVDSFLWKYLHESALIRKSFLLYHPEPPSPHPLLRLEGSFEQYMAKFSPKHRKNLNREVKRIREGIPGPSRFDRFERPEQVGPFLEQAVEVSRKTYQWTLHQRGLSATETLRKRLLFAAHHGWMRCYLLSCGERPCAFLVGFQYGGRFLLHEIGFDPALARHSVGTVLQMLTVEDLFAYDRPEVLDLGDYGNYKESLSTESYLQGKVFLFRRGAYPRLARAGHRCCEWVTRASGSALERLHLKTKVRQIIRGWSRAR